MHARMGCLGTAFRYVAELSCLVALAWLALFVPCATAKMLAGHVGGSLAAACLLIAAPPALLAVWARPLFGLFSPLWGVLAAMRYGRTRPRRTA